jgi:hypothetical protein
MKRDIFPGITELRSAFRENEFRRNWGLACQQVREQEKLVQLADAANSIVLSDLCQTLIFQAGGEASFDPINLPVPRGIFPGC